MIVAVVMIVVVIMPAARFVIQRIAEFSVVVVHVDLTLGKPVFEGGHEVDLITDGA